MIFATAFSLLILNSFSGTFTASLTVPKRAPEIETLEQLKEGVKAVCVHYSARDILFRNKDHALRDFNILNDYFCFSHDQLMGRELAYVDSEGDLEILRRDHEYIEKGLSLFRIVPECVWTPAYQSFPVRKDWRLADRYSALVQRLLEGGVVRKLQEETLTNYTIEYLGRMHFEAPPSSEPEVLTPEHFREAFLLLGVGLGAAALSLLAEVAKGHRVHVRVGSIGRKMASQCILFGAWVYRKCVFSRKSRDTA